MSDLPEIPQEQALPLATIQPQPTGLTAAQGRIDAVANLTMKAYERAGTLQLTAEEAKLLAAEFPDEAFQPGAAGKEHLIYIEHVALRERLSQVFGPMQWAIIPRNRWAENFTTFKGKPGTRIYVEAMLVIRGAFAAEAVGSMDYYPHNESQDYGDACEGAKTAALRRCCKELGIGLQAWRKEWCQGWWDRRKAPKATAAPAATQPPKPLAKADEATRMRALNFLQAAPGQPLRNLVQQFFVHKGWIKGEQNPEDWPLDKVPTGKHALTEIGNSVAMFERQQATMNEEQLPME